MIIYLALSYGESYSGQIGGTRLRAVHESIADGAGAMRGARDRCMNRLRYATASPKNDGANSALITNFKTKGRLAFRLV